MARHFFLLMIFMMLLVTCSDDSGLLPLPTTPTTVPNAPTNVKAEVKSSTSILVTWSSVSGAVSYEVYYETDSTFISKLSTVTGTSYTHSGLQPDVFYKYYITAKNSAGTSDFSSPATATTPGAVPASPTGVNATVESLTSVRVSWNRVSGAISYDVYYTVGNESSKKYAANLASSPYIHTGLSWGTTYTYYIKAINNFGESSFSSSARTTTPIDGSKVKPASPTGVSASLESSTSVRVSWDRVSNATSYDVYYAVGSYFSTKIFAATVTSSPYIHTNLTPDTRYYYYIKAKNSVGDSDYSSYSSATTPTDRPARPTGVSASLESSTSVRVSWDRVSNATSYDVYYAVGYSSYTKNFAANVTDPLYIHTNLTPGYYHYYYIKAKNNAGDSDFSGYAEVRAPE